MLLLLLSRRGGRWVVGVLAALCAASVVAQLVWAQVDTDHAYYGTDARLYQLLAGSLLALLLHRLQPVATRLRPGVVGWAGLAASCCSAAGWCRCRRRSGAWRRRWPRSRSWRR